MDSQASCRTVCKQRIKEAGEAFNAKYEEIVALKLELDSLRQLDIQKRDELNNIEGMLWSQFFGYQYRFLVNTSSIDVEATQRQLLVLCNEIEEKTQKYEQLVEEGSVLLSQFLIVLDICKQCGD